MFIVAGLQINRRLLVQKFTTEVPPTKEGSSPPAEKVNGAAATPPNVNFDDVEGVAATPPNVNPNVEAAAASSSNVNFDDVEGVAATPPNVIPDDVEGAAPPPPPPPPNMNSDDVKGAAEPPPNMNSDDAGGAAPPPPNGNPDDADEELREKILRASLTFVLEHGWTQKTLSSGAESLGLPSVAHGMFPKGGVDLINFFSQDCNAQLTKQLAQKVEENKQLEDGTKPSTRTFIQEALQARLEMLVPYIERWPQAMAIQAQPQNSCQALSNLCHLVDDIWHYAGDKSTDLNWYSKRFIVAGIYKSTQIFMVQDKSEDFQDTWIFLDNRFNNVADIGQNVKQCKNATTAVADNLWGMSLMLQNILGVNSRVR